MFSFTAGRCPAPRRTSVAYVGDPARSHSFLSDRASSAALPPVSPITNPTFPTRPVRSGSGPDDHRITHAPGPSSLETDDRPRGGRRRNVRGRSMGRHEPTRGSHPLGETTVNDDQPANNATTASRGRLMRVGRSLAASTARGLATGAGTAAGTWVVWWITHH